MVGGDNEEEYLSRANRRLVQALRNQSDKGKAYENDPLFLYLWRAGWGTSEYSGRGIVRLIDGWVARLSRFEKARTAYWLLNEIPQRLQKHIQELETST